MSDWRDGLLLDPGDGIGFAVELRFRVSPAGRRAVEVHARGSGLSRQEWLQRAVAAQLRAEGAEWVPDMRVYQGTKLRMEVPGAARY